MSGGTPEIVGVRGGAAGVAASYAAARELATLFDQAGDRIRSRGMSSLGLITDADLIESALLSPLSFAEAEAAVLKAATGPDGMISASLPWEGIALAVRGALAALEFADESVRSTVLSVNRTLVNKLGDVYGDPGVPVVNTYDDTLGTHAETGQPETVRDLIDHLRQVADLSPTADSPGNGTVEVQTITTADGKVRHVLYLPGTDDFNPPWVSDGDVRDLESGLDSLGGQPDAYLQGILQVLAQAGVQPSEPILVVGHSLGGMEAAALATGNHGFNVTDVVTAGSPTAQVGHFPAGTNVLSLEEKDDIVPMADLVPNPDSIEQTTVVFDSDAGDGVVANHAYPAYLQGAELVDSAGHPSVTAAVQSLHEEGFLGDGGQVRSQLFQITRAPRPPHSHGEFTAPSGSW